MSQQHVVCRVSQRFFHSTCCCRILACLYNVDCCASVADTIIASTGETTLHWVCLFDLCAVLLSISAPSPEACLEEGRHDLFCTRPAEDAFLFIATRQQAVKKSGRSCNILTVQCPDISLPPACHRRGEIPAIAKLEKQRREGKYTSTYSTSVCRLLCAPPSSSQFVQSTCYS